MVQNSTVTKRGAFIAAAICIPVAIVVLLGAFGNAATARYEEAVVIEPGAVRPSLAVEQKAAAQSSTAPDGFVFRFDPMLESFETITIPTPGANPHSVTVISNTTSLDVWFTEPGVDKIGRLVYTATQDYAFHEYTLTLGSGPLNLVQDGVFVWFTARRGNYIGRVEVTSGQVVTFGVPTTNSHPSGIDLAPDGSVWFTEMATDKIGHLVVTTTSDYEVVEYPIVESGVRPYDIEVQSDQFVWFSETATGRVRRLKIADGSMVRFFSLGADSYPADLLYDSGRDFLWVTEHQDNQITSVEIGTLYIPNSFDVLPPGNFPRGLERMGDNEFWFSKYASDQIGCLVYTSPLSFQFEAFTLPVKGLFTPHVMPGVDGGVWVVSHHPHSSHLPLVVRNYNNGPPPLFGVQMYGAINHTTGLSEVVSAGARWIRVPISWQAIEPANVTPDQYNWNSLDAQVVEVTGAGIEPLLTLGGNPSWAAVYSMGPVTDIADLQEFMGALIERYDGDGVDDAPGSPIVTYWEIYNEPDGTDEWHAQHGGYGFFGYHGDVYAALLDAIYPVVKAASPKARVVFGGVAHDNFDYEGGAFDPDFIEDVLDNCTGPCFDVMNFHYFPLYRFRWEPYGRDVAGKVAYFRSLMASYGFDRPIMCTETTWVGTGEWGSEALKARYIIPVYVRGMAADLVLVNWFAWKDMDSSMPGLLDGALQPKPAYYVFQTLTEQLGRAVFERALTKAETGHSSIEGYVFSVSGTDAWERRDVVWLDCETLELIPPQDCPGESRTMNVSANAVQITDQFGVATTVQDEDDGSVDGWVKLTITPDPIFIDYVQ